MTSVAKGWDVAAAFPTARSNIQGGRGIPAPGTLSFGALKMKLLLLAALLLFATGFAAAAQAGGPADEAGSCPLHAGSMGHGGGPGRCKNEDVVCSPEMRGRCGKRRGDWYGASHAVADATEARRLLVNYFAGQGYTVSGVREKRWGFKAEILDRDDKVVDRVMIDKRFGRIRSLY